MPPPSANPLPVLRTCAFRPRPNVVRTRHAAIGMHQSRGRLFATDKSKDLPQATQDPAGPNMNQQEHVSEEAAKIAKIQGGSGPDIEGQGTPVQEILQKDKAAMDNAPQVLKDEIRSGAKPAKPSSGRSFSTLARRQAEAISTGNAFPVSGPESDAMFNFKLPAEAQSTQPVPTFQPTEVEKPLGYIFPLPEMPMAPTMNKDRRYDPIVAQVTNLMMQHGEKARAQRNMATILNILRTSPPPKYNPSRPLLPGAPPASFLPLNPIMYLTLAIDSVAPLMRIRSQRGAAGGGVALQIPVPLGARPRRRIAFQWILETAGKRKARGSGKDMFAQKVAEEIISVIEGRSSVWERRSAVHKLGTTARSNLALGPKKR